MFGEQRRRLALLKTFVLLAGAGAVAVGAGQTVAGAQSPDPDLPPDCQRAVAFDPDDFDRSTRINNRFLPLKPGRQLVLEGRANRGGGPLPHRVTFTVTNLIKVINGVRTRVMWDVDENEGEVVEAELAFFAQDNDGNVWNLGEYPEEYEDGFFLGAPSTWIAGVGDAEGGIHMRDNPRLGDSYMQGFVPDIDFLDCATVFDRGLRTCVPVRCFNDILLTHERSPLDPEGGIQTKAHAPRVGLVEVGAVDDPEGETLVLVEPNRLDRASMEAVRQEALKLDQRAYRVSEVYRATKPIRPLPPPPSATAPAPQAPTPGVAAPSPAAQAPLAPTGAGPKPTSLPRSCYASRRAARRAYWRAVRLVRARGGGRAMLKRVLKRMRRKACAERRRRCAVRPRECRPRRPVARGR
jgi:hypothetical protein